MELSQIKYFVKLAELLSFTEAAKELFITQSTLSISIKQLEEELGVKLFDRIGKKVFITESGTVFLSYATKAFTHLYDGVQEINALNHIFRGQLNIGVTYSTREILNSHIVDYTRKYPGIKLTVRMFNTVEEVMSGLISNNLDIAITYAPEKLPPNVEMHPLSVSPLSVIVSDTHALADSSRVSLLEMKDYQFATFLRGMHTRMMVERLFLHNNLSIEPHIEVNDTNLILEMVATGNWFSILSPISIQGKSGCIAIPICGTEELLSVSILWLKGKSKQTIYNTFIDAIIK